MHEPDIFFGGEVVAWAGEALVEMETPEQIKARRELEKERKKNPNQSTIFMEKQAMEDEKFYKDHPELQFKTTEELINDLPF